jgi:dihydroorotate dehydrogenase (NAD+) catalytic subunit
MNAAGWAKTIEHVCKLVKVPTLTHVVMGSFTVEPREGNTGGTNFDVAPDGTAVNSIGLRNDGLPYLKAHGAEMAEMVRRAGKTPVFSIAGFAPSEFGTLAEAVKDIGAMPELNVGCPNVHDHGAQHEIISYNFWDLERTLQIVCREVSPHKTVWIKLSPYANPLDHEKAVRVLNKFAGHIVVVGCNTFPNVSMYHRNGRPYVDVANNYAGMSGTALKWINLSQCRRYVEKLDKRIPVLGVGGVSEAQDGIDYLRVGCRGVQIGAAFFHGENFRVFEQVAEGFTEAA